MSDERRERYAAAIQRRATGGIKLNSILPEVYAAADAAMAVADAEQTELRHSLHSAGRAWEDYTRENARLRAELEQLREYTAELEEQVIATGGHQAAAEEHEAAIDRVRALHERREGDDGSSYCDVCSNHGDIAWPCATIAAVDELTKTTEED